MFSIAIVRIMHQEREAERVDGEGVYGVVMGWRGVVMGWAGDDDGGRGVGGW